MMASVSMTAREYFGALSGIRRSTNFWNSGRVWKRQPVARFTSSTERPVHSSRNSPSRRRRVSAPMSSSNSRRIALSATGSCEASNAASMMRFASVGLSIGQFYVNRGGACRLGDLNERFAHQFEQRNECHHEDRRAVPDVEQFGEFAKA